jgi:hypothetical protein
MADDVVLSTHPDWLVRDAVARRWEHRLDKTVLWPWRRPCKVRVLLVTDGGLDFGTGDFGLSTFVGVLLNDGRSYVRFNLTLAHLRPGVSNAAVMAGSPGISASIKGFVFDDSAHFDPDGFDEVWLFGIETSFHAGGYPHRAADPARYPAGSLGDGELAALTHHMNRGGGVFATGDHSALGRCLAGSVNRARSMRYWESFLAASGLDEVSMSGARRNDSNVVGHDTPTQFSDQSDDVPQSLDLRLYSTPAGILREARYPHPVMCSRLGRIDVFPDHPHEGQCRVPDDLSLACSDGTPEYPDATDGSGQVEPEVVAWGHVPAGNTAHVGGGPTKQATQAHSFAVVSTYDGHRAGVGRVVCDSTWHHFVNVNLIGILEGGVFDDFAAPGTDPSKHDGFLSSPAGQAALAKIREYYINVAVWIATPERVGCMKWRPWWDVVWNDRVVEATLDDLRRLDDVSLVHLFHVGVHARDVLGRSAGACQSLHWLFPIFDKLWPELRPWIDPWWVTKAEPRDPPLPWFDPEPLLDTVVGGAVVALRSRFPYPDEEILEQSSEATEEVALAGAEQAVRRLRESLGREVRDVMRLLG